jgi:Secretion system C-terminal sorting domain
MKRIFNFVVLYVILFSIESRAQMTLAYNIPKSKYTQAEVVNLSRSGKKILTMTDNAGTYTADTLYFYNLDYSFWKMIPCPALPGCRANFNFFHEQGQYIGVYYPSESLFNIDTFLEVAVYYNRVGSGGFGPLCIINENGIITDSIPQVEITNSSGFSVFEATSGVFKAIATTSTGVVIYDLPGTIPCSTCGSISLGLAKKDKKKQREGIETNVMPNPSKDQFKITFQLPEGARDGKLSMYNTNGQLVKSYVVDNRFGFLLIDSKDLTPGLYYYNVVSNGSISESQRVVVLR